MVLFMKRGNTVILDFHTHILPGIDDGAKSTKESKGMLEEIQRQRSDPVVLTPHFYPYECSAEDFLKKRAASYERLKSVMKEKTPVLVGCEIFLSPLLLKNKNLRSLCINGTDFALIELPFTDRLDDKIFSLLEDLRYDHGIRPIIAHVERYKSINNNHKLIDVLIDCGCMIQVNAQSFMGPFFKKRFVFDLLKSNKIDFLGSDCHNLTTRPPNLAQALNFIVKKKGEQSLLHIREQSEMFYKIAIR